MLVIHLAAVVLHSIAYHQIIHMQQNIVGGNLLQHLLQKGKKGSIVFYDGKRLERTAVQDGVASQLLFADAQFHLVCQ